MATPDQINEYKRRLAYLRSLGYTKVPQDGSWGLWLEDLWRKATTRKKLYSVSPIGLLQRGWDTMTGNTTYRVEHPEGEIGPAPLKRSNLATVGAIATTAGGKSSPYGIAATIPLVVGSALLLGNGPEIMRSIDDAGNSAKSYIDNLINGVISRFDDIEDRESPPSASPQTSNQSSSVGTPNPLKDEEPDSTKNKKSLRDLLWRRSGKPSSGRLSKFVPSRATVENYGVRLPLYTGVAAPVADLGLNAVGRAYTPDSVPYSMKFPLTKARFSVERGILGLIGDAYKETAPTPGNNPADSVPLVTLPPGFRPVQGVNDSNNLIVVPNSTGESDSIITIEPVTRNRFGRGGNLNQ